MERIKLFLLQSINVPGVANTLKIAVNSSLCLPHLSVNKLDDIDFHWLKNHCGIRVVIFDKDNTLTIPFQSTLHPSVEPSMVLLLLVFDIGLAYSFTVGDTLASSTKCFSIE